MYCHIIVPMTTHCNCTFTICLVINQEIIFICILQIYKRVNKFTTVIVGLIKLFIIIVVILHKNFLQCIALEIRKTLDPNVVIGDRRF